MNNKQLIKVIKALVEVEVAKKQELFLSKTFPKILEAEVSKRLLEVTKTSKKVLTKKVQEIDYHNNNFKKILTYLLIWMQNRILTKQLVWEHR